MSERRRLTREELDALREQIQAGAGDWGAELISVDGIPADQYEPADEAVPPQHTCGITGYTSQEICLACRLEKEPRS